MFNNDQANSFYFKPIISTLNDKKKTLSVTKNYINNDKISENNGKNVNVNVNFLFVFLFI